MGSRAAIYVRTSSAQQATLASPEEQERDCLNQAQMLGLTIAQVYRDVDSYKAGEKLVSPSGQRCDRPGLMRMMADGRMGQFDTVIAWREDRLYRALRPMLAVLEWSAACGITIELAKEHFDPTIAPIRAYVGQMELEALSQRMTMGVKARLRAGKANTGQDRYGYRRVGGEIVVVEEEARWVRQIFAWYCERVPLSEIRRRLIEAGAPQKGSSIPRKVQWARTSIQGVLQAGEEYALGVKRHSRAGEVFVLAVEPIITLETWEQARAIRADNRTLPARDLKWDYLARGLIYCPCGRRWASRMTGWRAKGVKRKTPSGVYYCTQLHAELIHPDCPRSIGSQKLDEALWSTVQERLIDRDGWMDLLLEQEKETEALRARAMARAEELRSRIAKFEDERKWVTRQARRGVMTDEEMDRQFQEIANEELMTRRWLTMVTTLPADEGVAEARDRLQELVTRARDIDSIEDERERFNVKRELVEAAVSRVNIGRDRALVIEWRLSLGS